MMVSFKNNVKFLVLFFLIISAIGVFGQGSASAAYGNGADMPYTQDFTGNNVQLVVSKVFPGNGLDAPESEVKIYSTSQQVNIDIFGFDHCSDTSYVDNDSNTFSPTTYRVFATDSSENSTVAVASVSNASPSCNYNLSKPLNITLGSSGTKSERSAMPGRTQYYVYTFKATILSGGVNGFRLRVNNASSYIGYSAGFGTSSTVPGYKFAIQNRTGLSGGTSSFNIPFAGECNSPSNSSPRILWFDDDWGTIQTDRNSFYFRVLDQSANGGAGAYASVTDGSGPVTTYYPKGGGGVLQNVSVVNFDATHKYIWQWSGVADKNGIQFQLPYDSINFNTMCPPPICTQNCPPAQLPPPPRVSGIKISDVPADNRQDIPIGGAAGGQYPFSDDKISALRAIDNAYVHGSAANPFYFRTCAVNVCNDYPAGYNTQLSEGQYRFSATDQSAPDTNWAYLGYKICDAASPNCTNEYLNSTSNLRAPGDVQTLYNGRSYNMRFIYHKNVPVNNPPSVTITANCSASNAVITVYDADGGPASVTYSVNGGGEQTLSTFVSGSGSVTIPMGGYNQYYVANISAHSIGVTPNGADPSDPYWQSAPYGQSDNVACRVNNPPSISSSRDCSAQVATIYVSDADAGSGTVYYSIDNGPETAKPLNFSPSNAFNIDMTDAVRGPNFQYDPHTVTARTTGVNENSPPNVAPISGEVPTSVVYGMYPGRACQDRKFAFSNSGPNLSLNPDEEAPTFANAGMTITLNIVPGKAGLLVSTSVDRYFYLIRNGIESALPSPAPQTITLTDGQNIALSDNSPLSGLIRGDKVCVRVTLSPQKGLVGSDGTVTVGAPDPLQSPKTDCKIVVDKPYFRVYGSDIRAGGSFIKTGVCSAPQSGQGSIIGQYRLGKGGAGTELANIALIKVTGVASASLRTSLPTEPNGLTFANSSIPSPNGVAPPDSMGGSYNTGNYCVPDYFTTEQFDNGDPRKALPPGNGVVNFDGSYPDGGQTVKSAGGLAVKVKPNSVINKRHTLFVDGNVEITDNILYPSTVLSDPAAVPYITIIVKGNIYIDPDVTEISGLFIAQPLYKADGSVDNTTGKIYTCSDKDRNPSISGPQFLSNGPKNCTRKLTVNGSFIAQRIVLQRAVGSLRDSSLHEGPGSAPISESFQSSPEYYFGKPVFRPQKNTYDSIKSLPPIL